MSGELTGPAPTGSRDFLLDFAEMSTFGATAGGGVERLAGSPEDAAVRGWLTGWLRSRGMRVTVDGVGNLYGLVELVPDAPYVAVGSHLDSQPLGGRYDGAYGVLAAAHAVDRVTSHVRAVGVRDVAYNLAVVDWFNEEGARFAPSMMGSSVAAGKMALSHALATTDREGGSVRDALAAIGYLGEGEAPSLAAYAEIHVEQGRLLENAGLTIGLVDSTWAARKFEVRVLGEQSHTGSTVLADRRDALYAAARVIVAVRALAARRVDPPALHASVSEMEVLPNSPVVVAREVRMNLDLRSPSPDVLEHAVTGLNAEIAAIAEDARVHIELRSTHAWDVQPYTPEGVGLAAEASAALGLSSLRMMTIAGHDSTNMKDVVPTVMLFVPSADGIAHKEDEFTEEADCLAGVDLLTEVVSRMVRGALG